MTMLTIQETSRLTGLSEPTLRYYEQVGLIGPVAPELDRAPDEEQALACLRAMGVGIDDMRTYQANRRLGHAAAGDQRDILLRHAERVEIEIATLQVHREYLERKAALWDARDRGDASGEAAAQLRVNEILPELEHVMRAA